MQNVLSLVDLALDNDAERSMFDYPAISCGLSSDISDHC